MGNDVMRALAPHTTERTRRASVKVDQSRIVSRILQTFDADHSNSLNHAEVMEMCISLAGSAAPNIPITDADVDMVMRVGGKTAKAEITGSDIPAALSSVLALKSENEWLHNMFVKYDRDNSGCLAREQLSEFLTEINDGVIPCSLDLDYVLEQCDVSQDGGIDEAEIKAATTAWYCLMDETPLPKTTEEARAMGYTQEQIDFFLQQKKEEYEATIGNPERHQFEEGEDLGYGADGSFKERRTSITDKEAEDTKSNDTPHYQFKEGEDLGYGPDGALKQRRTSNPDKEAQGTKPNDTPAPTTAAEGKDSDLGWEEGQLPIRK